MSIKSKIEKQEEVKNIIKSAVIYLDALKDIKEIKEDATASMYNIASGIIEKYNNIFLEEGDKPVYADKNNFLDISGTVTDIELDIHSRKLWNEAEKAGIYEENIKSLQYPLSVALEASRIIYNSIETEKLTEHYLAEVLKTRGNDLDQVDIMYTGEPAATVYAADGKLVLTVSDGTDLNVNIVTEKELQKYIDKADNKEQIENYLKEHFKESPIKENEKEV